MPRWETEGDVLVEHVDWGLKQFDSGAVAFNVMHRVVYWWNGSEWINVAGNDATFYGSYFLIDKSDNPLDGTVAAMVSALGWDGDLRKLSKSSGWEPARCRVVVTKEEYKGKTQYRGSFLNPWDSPPRGGGVSGTIDNPSALEQRFGAKFRALAKRAGATPPTASTPPAQATLPGAIPPPSSGSAPDGPPDDGAPPLTDDDLPF